MNRKKLLSISLLCLILLMSCSQEKAVPPLNIGDLVRHQSLGLAYLEENRVQDAKAEYQRIVQLAPQESLGNANLAICLLREGDYTGANQQIQQAIQKSDTPDARLIIVEIDDRSGKLDQGINDA